MPVDIQCALLHQIDPAAVVVVAIDRLCFFPKMLLLLCPIPAFPRTIMCVQYVHAAAGE